MASNGDEPDWITYYSPAHLERDLGRALLYLAVNGGDYRPAQERLNTAVERFPTQLSRGKTLAMANLAHLTMARDDLTQAVALGHQTLMSSARSALTACSSRCGSCGQRECSTAPCPRFES